MSVRWVLNRRFRAGPLDATSGHWILESSDDAPCASHVQIVFLHPKAAAVPAEIDVREIRRRSADEVRSDFLIDSAQGEFPVRAQTLYVHETPGWQYGAALPPQAISLARRWSWRLLLAAIRIPGVFALLARLRRGRR